MNYLIFNLYVPGIPKSRLNEFENELNAEFRDEIREHGSIETAYGRMVCKHSYRLLDGREYGNESKLLRSLPRWAGEGPEETDDVSTYLASLHALTNS